MYTCVFANVWWRFLCRGGLVSDCEQTITPNPKKDELTPPPFTVSQVKGGHQRRERPLHCAVALDGDGSFVKALLQADDYEAAMNAQVCVCDLPAFVYTYVLFREFFTFCSFFYHPFVLGWLD